VVERASLESLYTGNRIVGSNPTFTAERDLSLKKGVSPFFILAKSPDIRAISKRKSKILGAFLIFYKY
jgi:hypothetical protein